MKLRIIRAHWLSLVLVLLTGFFVYQHLQLIRINRFQKLKIMTAASEQVRLGDRVEHLAGTTVGGVFVRRSVTGVLRGSLIVGLSPSCGVCAQNRAAWTRVSAHARTRGAQIVWVSRDGVPGLVEFVAPASLSDGLIAEPTHPTYLQLRLNLVPQTLVVSATGIVEYARTGLLRDGDEQAVIRVLDSLTPVAVAER